LPPSNQFKVSDKLEAFLSLKVLKDIHAKRYVKSFVSDRKVADVAKNEIGARLRKTLLGLNQIGTKYVETNIAEATLLSQQHALYACSAANV